MSYGIKNFDGNIKRIHLEDGSNPYTTYKVSGLPPGPIASPGRDALRAIPGREVGGHDQIEREALEVDDLHPHPHRLLGLLLMRCAVHGVPPGLRSALGLARLLQLLADLSQGLQQPLAVSERTEPDLVRLIGGGDLGVHAPHELLEALDPVDAPR